MLHAPVNEKNGKVDANRASAESTLDQESRTLASGWVGPGPSTRLGSRLSAGTEQRERWAGLQRAYGNQAVLRMMAMGRKSDGAGGEIASDVEEAIERARGGGQALDSGIRRRMEGAFGADFSAVRIHTDGEADNLNRSLSARAFTTDRDIFFREGEYGPSSTQGRELLAHELTHVVQQAGAPVQGKLTIGAPDDAHEREADWIAEQATQMPDPSALVHEPIHVMQQRSSDQDGLGQQPPVLHRKTDPAEVERVRKLKDYKVAVKEKDWESAAILLNGFNEADIEENLRALNLEELRLIDDAALKAMAGWSDPVHIPAEKLIRERERVATLKREYEEAVRKPDWDQAAILLNGFSDQDIEIRVNQLSIDDLRQLDASALKLMADWPNRVHRAATKALLRKIEPSGGEAAQRAGSLGEFAAPSAAKLEKMSEKERRHWETRDAKAREFGAADYEDYVRNVLVSGGSVFGRKIPAEHPVHPLFLDRLERASAKARELIGSDDFGVGTINGQDNRPGNHAWGLAIDADATANPYVLNEAQDVGIDTLTAPVYERIAQTLLNRSSVLTPGSREKKTGLAGASYTLIAEENDAMVAYFSVLRPEEGPAGDAGAGKTPAKQPILPPIRKLSKRTFSAELLATLDKDQVRRDYNLLIGKEAVEDVDGVKTPVAMTPAWREKQKIKGDFPFEGAGAGGLRDPARGFLTLREEIVEAARAEGLRWGGTDFEGASGDMMHIDDGNRHADYVAYGQKNPTQKRNQPA